MQGTRLALWTFGFAALHAAPAAAADWTGEAGFVSDYRFRGVSLSAERPAVQGGVAVATSSGLHGELWGSTIEDESSGHVELDAAAGYGLQLSEAVSLDLSITYYDYPASTNGNAVEAALGLETSRGPLTLDAGLSIAPPQSGTRDDTGRKKHNAYAFAGASYALPNSLSLHASIGYERGPWDMIAGKGKWDWSAGIMLEQEQIRLGLDQVGSSASSDAFVGSLSVRF